MIDINRIVEFATIQGYYISDLYKAMEISKASFQNIRKSKTKHFSMDYFYKVCNYMGISIEMGIKIFDSKSTINLNEYEIEYDNSILENRILKINEVIKYARNNQIYIKDIIKELNIEKKVFKEYRKEKDQVNLKKYFFKMCKYINIPYGRALEKYTEIKEL